MRLSCVDALDVLSFGDIVAVGVTVGVGIAVSLVCDGLDGGLVVALDCCDNLDLIVCDGIIPVGRFTVLSSGVNVEFHFVFPFCRD